VAVHAQSLRTALAGAPFEASRPASVLILTLAALLVLMKDWRLAVVSAALGSAALVVAATFSLRSGVYVSVAIAIVTLFAGAFASRWVSRLR
jgi:hypothetical protein